MDSQERVSPFTQGILNYQSGQSYFSGVFFSEFFSGGPYKSGATWQNKRTRQQASTLLKLPTHLRLPIKTGLI